MKRKTALFQVFDHTKGAIKCHEVDRDGEKTQEIIGALYLRKSAFGEMKVGTIFQVEVVEDLPTE